MPDIDEAVREAIDAVVVKRFNNLFARLADIEKGIKETNQRVTQVRCRMGELGADEPVDRSPRTDYQVIHEFMESCIRHRIIRRGSPQYRNMSERLERF